MLGTFDEMEKTGHFTIFDFIIFFGFMGISLLIGIFFAYRSRNKNSIANYFLGNRKLSVIPTALSLVVSFQSSLLIIGVPAEVYAYGFKYAYVIIGGSASYVFAAIFVVPVFHPLKLTSVYAYFNLRYHNNNVRYLAMALGIAYYVLYMGMVTFGTCVALEFLIGIPYWGTILIFTCITTIYTSLGGMKAVIWTDVFQITIMVTGVIAVIAKSTVDVGGMSNLLEEGSSRMQMNDFRIDPTIRYQFWNCAIGVFTAFLTNCYQQPSIQRINSSPDVSSARRILLLSSITYIPIMLAVCFEGVAIFTYYNHKGCDPIESGRITGYDQIIPLAVADMFTGFPGLPGLFISALSGAALSTLSSSLNSLGTVTYDDIIRVRYPNLSERRATNISKVVVLLYGFVAMVAAFLIANLPGSIINIFYAISSSIDGPTSAIFLVSTMYKQATSKGIITGTCAGIAVTMWLNLAQMMTTTKVTPVLTPASMAFCPTNTSMASFNETYNMFPFNATGSIFLDMTTSAGTEDAVDNFSTIQMIHSLSFMWFSLTGCLVSIVVSILVSCVTTPPDVIDDRCFFSFRKHVLEELCGMKCVAKREKKTTSLEDVRNQHEMDGLIDAKTSA